ncbi:hypothetical protein ACFLS1_05170, partial [Verrucomicrobiota bacterium]
SAACPTLTAASESTKKNSTHHELKKEIDHYLHEKERIRKIVGRIGGVPRTTDKIINISFLLLVGISFAASIFIQGLEFLPIEVAVLLVSLKLIYVVTQNAKLNHSQFWMLSTIEWRLNEMAKELRKIKKKG